MAISGDTIFEVRTTGSDNNGGGFVAGASGTDYSQQNAAQGSGTNLTVDATTNTDVLPDGYTAAAGDVGNIIQITAGAGFTTGFYEIKSIQGTKWRLDRSPAAVGTSGGTWAMGGALASPGKASAAAVAGNTIYIKYGTYSVTSASTNVANGCVSGASGTAFIGYDTNRNPFNTDTRVIIDLSVGTATLFQGGGIYSVRNIQSTGTTGSSFTGTQYQQAYNCYAISYPSGAFKGPAFHCQAGSCTQAFQYNAWGCTAFSCNVGFYSTGQVMWVNCLSVNSNGTGYGFQASGSAYAFNCVAYGSGSHGFCFSGGAASTNLVNCISVNSGGYGYYMGGYNRFLKNCAHYNNTSGGIFDSTVGVVADDGTIALTAAPFVDPTTPTWDFSLNSTSGGGAALKNAGWPTAFVNISTPTYLDVGAARHQDPAAGGGAALARIFGGF